MLKPHFFHTAATPFVFLLLFNSNRHTENNLMKYFQNGQATELSSMKIAGVNAFLKDIVFSNDPDSPIICGLFRMEKGAALEYTYTYDEATIILEGEITFQKKVEQRLKLELAI